MFVVLNSDLAACFCFDVQSEVRRLGKEKEEETSAKEAAMEQGKDAVRNRVNSTATSYSSSDLKHDLNNNYKT